MSNNSATNHAIMLFFIISILLVHNHDFLSSSSSKPIKSTPSVSTCACISPNPSNPHLQFTTNSNQIAISVFLAFLSGVLFTVLCMKLLRPSPPPPPLSQTVDHQLSIASSGGISASLLKSLPIFVYFPENRPKLGKGGGECAICLTEFLNEQTLRWLPDCDHLFHRGCIDTWFESHKTCPCCRANVERVDGEILQPENGSNSMNALGEFSSGDGRRESDDGRRVGCERSVVTGLFRVLMGRRRPHSHRSRHR